MPQFDDCKVAAQLPQALRLGFDLFPYPRHVHCHTHIVHRYLLVENVACNQEMLDLRQMLLLTANCHILVNGAQTQRLLESSGMHTVKHIVLGTLAQHGQLRSLAMGIYRPALRQGIVLQQPNTPRRAFFHFLSL